MGQNLTAFGRIGCLIATLVLFFVAPAHAQGSKPLSAYGIESETALVASEPDIDLYRSSDANGVFYVAIHKNLAPDQPIGIFARQPDGSYQISDAFHQRLLKWGVYPELPAGYTNASVFLRHYIQGFTHPGDGSPGSKGKWVLITTHSRYSQSGEVDYPAFTEAELPPLSIAAITGESGGPNDTMLAMAEQLPGRTPETVAYAVKRPAQWPAPDIGTLALPMDGVMGRGADVRPGSRLRLELANSLFLMRFAAGAYYTECEASDDDCERKHCVSQYEEVTGHMGRGASQSAAVRALQTVNRESADGKSPYATSLIQLSCVNHALDLANAAPEAFADAPFEQPYERARNIIVANALLHRPSELDATDVVAFSLGYSFGKATLADARAFISKANDAEIDYPALLAAYERYYDEHDLTKALGLPNNKPVLIADDVDLSSSFVSNGQRYTFRDAIDLYTHRARIDAVDRVGLPMNASPMAFQDDNNRVYVVGYDPVTRWLGVDTYTAEQAKLRINGKPASPLLAGAEHYYAIKSWVDKRYN